MDPLARKRLEERIVTEVQTMLMEGDRSYLQKLARAALLEALETELQFLGLYSYDDLETPVVIHMFLEKHLDQWYEDYLWENEIPILREQQPTFEVKIQIAESSLMQLPSSTGVGITMTEATSYIGFMPPIDHLRIQVSTTSE